MNQLSKISRIVNRKAENIEYSLFTGTLTIINDYNIENKYPQNELAEIILDKKDNKLIIWENNGICSEYNLNEIKIRCEND